MKKGTAYSEFDMDFFLQFLSNQIPQKKSVYDFKSTS